MITRLSPLHRLLSLALALGTNAALGQDCVHEWSGTLPGDLYGFSARGGGDLDGDGVSELLISGQRADSTGTVVWLTDVYSGASGSLLRTHANTSAGEFLGTAVTFVADANGDGVDEYVIDYHNGSTQEHELRLHSGSDGREIARLALSVVYFVLPRLEALEDLDGDGVEDLVYADGGLQHGELLAVSTRTMTVLWQQRFEPGQSHLGLDLAIVPDLDSDGVGDLAVTNQLAADVVVLSSASGSELRRIPGDRDEGFASSLARCGDLTGDGVDDLVVGVSLASDSGDRHGAVDVFSGANLELSHRIEGEHDRGGFGTAVRSAGDANGDGIDDLAVQGWDQSGHAGSSLMLVSGSTGRTLYSFHSEWARLGPAEGLGDLDGDGLDDFVEAEIPLDAPGRVCVRGGNDLYCYARERDLDSGDILDVSALEGPTSLLAALAIVEVDATPVFHVLSIGSFSDNGGFAFQAAIPPGLGGLGLGILAFAQSAPRGVRVSAVERVKLH